MNKLKDLLNAISEKEAESRINPEDADPRVRAGTEAIQRNAKAALDPLKEQYKNTVVGSSVLIAVSGPGSVKFAELASQKVKVQTVDFKLIKKRMIINLTARGAGGLYSQNAHMMLWDEINKFRIEYGFLSLPQPQASYMDGIFDQPLDVAIEVLFEKNYGSSLYSAVTRREIGQTALNDGFSGDKFPVVVYNYTGSTDINFLPSPVKTVDVDMDVTERSVKQVLNDVRSLVTGKKLTQEETAPILGE